MSAGQALFLHTLIFDCPKCGNAVASRTLSTESNREAIDGATLQLICQCGWTGQHLGLRAREHSVENWSSNRIPSG